jgi:hypothetical protein
MNTQGRFDQTHSQFIRNRLNRSIGSIAVQRHSTTRKVLRVQVA